MNIDKGLLLPLAACLAAGFALGALTRPGPSELPQSGSSQSGPPQSGLTQSGPSEPAAGSSAWSIDISNDICPVMGGDARAEVFSEWRGLRMRFCCPGCESDFQADPEGMFAEVGFDHAAGLEALTRIEDAPQADRSALAAEYAGSFELIPPQSTPPQSTPNRDPGAAQ